MSYRVGMRFTSSLGQKRCHSTSGRAEIETIRTLGRNIRDPDTIYAGHWCSGCPNSELGALNRQLPRTYSSLDGRFPDEDSCIDCVLCNLNNSAGLHSREADTDCEHNTAA